VKKVDAIFCADLHLRPDRPIARTDNYQKAQFVALDFILDLQYKHECPIFCAGDFGNQPLNIGWPTWFSAKVIEHLNNFERPVRDIFVCLGQHDLPQHRLEAWPESGLGVLAAAEVIQLIGIKERKYIIIDNYCVHAFPYGTTLEQINVKEKSVALVHMMVIKDKPLWPGQQALTARAILEKYPGYDLIISGDNHQSFVETVDGRHLVNCGSMMRMRADQMDHEPAVFLWYAELNKIRRIALPIRPAEEVLTRLHIDKKEEKNERMTAYVESLKAKYEVGLSYTDNLDAYFQNNITRKNVKEKVWECVLN